MKIVDAYWTPRANILTIHCNCGSRFKHPANRIMAECPECRSRVNTVLLKNKHVGTLPQ